MALQITFRNLRVENDNLNFTQELKTISLSSVASFKQCLEKTLHAKVRCIKHWVYNLHKHIYMYLRAHMYIYM